MRQETYRFALDEATAELRDIVVKFEALRSRKEQIEAAVEALRPFIGLQSETPTIEMSSAVEVPEPVLEQPSPEPEFTFMQISGPGMEVASTETVPEFAEIAPEFVESEQAPEPVLALEEASAEQIAYFRQPSADPFQRRIDDALWGWQQRPEGLLSPI
jgi:hypothetical protein